ncbi:MAG: lytic murein transglycosylase [Desulfobulbaceae bacterium]|nr:lytic murein transglycosylase [Desulfobulbaceae bacterium]
MNFSLLRIEDMAQRNLSSKKWPEAARVAGGWLRAGLLGALLLLLAFPARGGEADFAAWLAGLRRQALAEGISAATFDAALAGVEPVPSVLESDRNQPEFKLNLETYLKRVVSEGRVAAGKERARALRPLLSEIAGQYGVPPRFLVALWGIESDYGRVLGGRPIIPALATLAFDPRRAQFFRAELLHVLHVLEERRAAPADLKGSWAGAIGGLQFLPSVYRRFGVDYNHDGRVDIWRDPGDLMASGGAYLVGEGWRRGKGWGCEVELTQAIDPQLLGHDHSDPVSVWQKRGVRLRAGGTWPLPSTEASLLIPDPANGRAFLVYDNFRVLLKWNHSDLFALAVGLLADRLGEAE